MFARSWVRPPAVPPRFRRRSDGRDLRRACGFASRTASRFPDVAIEISEIRDLEPAKQRLRQAFRARQRELERLATRDAELVTP